MATAKTTCLLATLLVLGSSAGAHAQGVGDAGSAATRQKSNTGTGMAWQSNIIGPAQP